MKMCVFGTKSELYMQFLALMDTQLSLSEAAASPRAWERQV